MPLGFDIGDTPKLTFTVRVDNVLTDAASVVLTLTKPDNTISTPTVSHPSTGTYTATLVTDQAGQWLYRWVATTPSTVEDGAFFVETNLTATLYATVGELRASLGDDTRQALDAGQLEQALRAASRAVDEWCQRPGGKFWLDPAATSRTYRPQDPYCAWIDDIGSSSGLVVKTDTTGDGTFATTWTASDYQLEPLNASVNGGAYAWWRLLAVGNQAFPYLRTWGKGQRPTLQVTARHGWSQVPEPVREATLLKAARLYRRKDVPFGNELGGGDFGPIRITREDSDVISLLSPFAAG